MVKQAFASFSLVLLPALGPLVTCATSLPQPSMGSLLTEDVFQPHSSG